MLTGRRGQKDVLSKKKKVTRNLDWEEDRVLLSDFICSHSHVAVEKEENSFFLILEHKEPSKNFKKKMKIPHFREVKAYSKIKVRDMLTPCISFSIL